MAALLTPMMDNLIGVHQALLYGGAYGLTAGRARQTFKTFTKYQGCLLPPGADGACANTSRPLNHIRTGSLSAVIGTVFDEISQVASSSDGTTSAAAAANLARWRLSPGLQFLNDMITQDMRSGLQALSDDETANSVVNAMHTEIRILFAVAVSYVVIVFYFGTFRRNVRNVIVEASQGRQFLSTIPLDKLSRTAADNLQDLFAAGGNEDEQRVD